MNYRQSTWVEKRNLSNIINKLHIVRIIKLKCKTNIAWDRGENFYGLKLEGEFDLKAKGEEQKMIFPLKHFFKERIIK